LYYYFVGITEKQRKEGKRTEKRVAKNEKKQNEKQRKENEHVPRKKLVGMGWNHRTVRNVPDGPGFLGSGTGVR